MELANDEIRYIGTDTNVLHGKTNLRRILNSKSDFFNCTSYTFKIQKGYKRFVEDKIEKYVENDEIKKFDYGGYRFPIYMCSEATFKFICGSYVIENVETLKDEFEEYLEISWQTQATLKVKIKDPSKYLIEFRFLPSNLGV